MMKRILKEPLLHFLALAVAVFVAYGVSNRFEAGKSDEIVITESRVDRIAAQFGAIWQRPPTSVELKNLIESNGAKVVDRVGHVAPGDRHRRGHAGRHL